MLDWSLLLNLEFQLIKNIFFTELVTEIYGTVMPDKYNILTSFTSTKQKQWKRHRDVVSLKVFNLVFSFLVQLSVQAFSTLNGINTNLPYSIPDVGSMHNSSTKIFAFDLMLEHKCIPFNNHCHLSSCTSHGLALIGSLTYILIISYMKQIQSYLSCRNATCTCIALYFWHVNVILYVQHPTVNLSSEILINTMTIIRLIIERITCV